MTTTCIGIDMGCDQMVVAYSHVSSPNSADIILNELSNRATPVVVAFRDKDRAIGEGAVGQLATNSVNAFARLPLMIGLCRSDYLLLKEKEMFDNVPIEGNDTDSLRFNVPYHIKGQESTTFSIDQIFSMMFIAARQQVVSNRVVTGGDNSECYVIAVPVSYSESQKIGIVRSARLAGIPVDSIQLTTSTASIAALYRAKQPLVLSESEKPIVRVLFANIGDCYSTISIVEFSKSTNTCKVISAKESSSIGGRAITTKLFDYFNDQLYAKFNQRLSQGSRMGYRLWTNCARAKVMLSTNPKTNFIMECVFNDTDFVCNITRSELTSICKDILTSLETLTQQCLSECGLSVADIDAVELIGGGTRSPLVAEVIAGVFNREQELLGRSLDGASCVSLGAAIMGASRLSNSSNSSHPSAVEVVDGFLPTLSTSDTEPYADWVSLEAAMNAQDVALSRAADQRNALESYILNTRNLIENDNAGLLDRVIVPWIDEVEEWMYGDGENATADEYESKKADLEVRIVEAAPKYFIKIARDKAVAEAQAEEQRQQWARERAATEHEDHDFRKLKKDDRMKIITRNKTEGNELIQSGNWVMALERYMKAMHQTTKFFDLTPADEIEVAAVKLSLYLNMALCNLKMQSWDKAIGNSTDALAIDSNNGKALYRRAQAYLQKNEFDKAEKDATQANQKNDPQISQLLDEIKSKKEATRQQEKAVYSKMFK